MSALHIERAGQGPTIVFTHGGGDSTATWAGQTAHFADRGHSTVAWDLRGHGQSAAPHDPAYYSRDLAVGDLIELLAEQPTVLAGHSLGGYLSLCMALRRPDLVRGLILVATGPGFRDQASMDGWNRRVTKGMAAMDVPDEAAGLLIHTDSWVLDNLGEITAPAVLIVGERDEMFSRATSYVASKLAGPVTTLVVPDAGHHVHRSRPEPVNAAIEAFLHSLPAV